MHQFTATRESILQLLKQALEQNQPKEIIERLQWFLHFAEYGSVSGTCRRFRIARSTFYRWLWRFDPNDLSTLTDLPIHKEVVFQRAVPVLCKVQKRPQHTIAKKVSSVQTHTCPFCRFWSWIQPLWRRCGRLTVLLSIFLNLALILFLLLPGSAGASSWSPTLLVNTESFQIIDDSDATADIYIQFGDSLSKKLTFERTLDRFNFNDDVYIGGNLGVSGTASGAAVHAQNSLTSSGTLTVSGNAEIRGTLSGANLTVMAGADSYVMGNVGIGTASPGTNLDVVGTFYVRPGASDIGQVTIDNQAGGTQSRLIMRDSAGVGKVILQSSGDSYLNGGNLGIGDTTPSTKLDVAGGISGTTLKVTGHTTLGNTVTIKGVTYTFPASDGSASGKVLKTDSSGNLSWSADTDTNTGVSQNDADTRYVNVSGDTMTGALAIKKTSGTSTGNTLVVDTKGLVYDATNKRVGIGTATPGNELEVRGTVSGSSLHAHSLLTSSGNMLAAGNITVNSDNGAADAVLTFGNDAAAETLRFNDTTNGFVFSDDVEVQGTLSGANLTVMSGAISYILGNVGIGTASPEYMLHLLEEGQASTNEPVDVMAVEIGSPTSGTTTGYGPAIIFKDLGITVNDMARIAAVYEESGMDNIGALSFYTNPVSGLEERMRITGGGFVGIGTTTPSTKLDVAGGISGTTLKVTGHTTLGNTVTIRGVNYTFPASDGSASGKVLKTDSSGNLSWSADTDTNTGVSQNDADARFVNVSGDTMTGALAIKKTSGTSTGNTLVVDTKGLVYDATNKRVGIGTASPETTLEVVGGISGSMLSVNSFDAIDFSRPTYDVVSFYQSDPVGAGAGKGLHVYNETDAKYLLNILEGGNVGIGTTAPTTRLEVVGTMSGKSLAIHTNQTNKTGALLLNQDGNGTGMLLDSEATNAPGMAISMPTSNAVNNPHLLFGYNNTFDTKLYRSAANTLTPSGHFVPSAHNTYDLGTSSVRWANVYSGPGSFHVGVDGNEARIGFNEEFSELEFDSDGDYTADVIVDKQGRMGIGARPSTDTLEVEGSAAKSSPGGWRGLSDIRIKKDVKTIENSLDTINALRPVQYRFKPEYLAEHPLIKDNIYYNFVAQEFRNVFPDSVFEDAAGYLQIDSYAVNPYLVGSVQELSAKVQALEKRMVSAEDAGSVLTISGGTIEITAGYHLVAMQDGKKNDVLAHIRGGVLGQVLVLQPKDKQKITLRMSGHLLLEEDFQMHNPGDIIVLLKIDDSRWVELTRSRSNGTQLVDIFSGWEQETFETVDKGM